MQDFAAKRNALFACLDDASKELKGTGLDQRGMDNRTISALKRAATDTTELVYRTEGNRQHSSSSCLSFMRGKESIFKKPELPIAKCLKPRTTPDYQVNPHKWKKYSLSDVDISDHTNTAAAFAFLKQIDEQRDTDAAADLLADGQQKIEFNKASKIKRTLKALEAAEVPDVELNQAKLKGSKLVMPEYVIGEKRSVKKKSDNSRRASTQKQHAAGSLKLAHLQEEEEDGEC